MEKSKNIFLAMAPHAALAFCVLMPNLSFAQNCPPAFGTSDQTQEQLATQNQVTVTNLAPPADLAVGTEVVLISGYEAASGAPGGTKIKVTINRPGKRVLLILATHENIVWDVEAGPKTRIKGVLVSSYMPPVLRMAKPAPAYQMDLVPAYEPGKVEFVSLQNLLDQKLRIKRIDVVRVRYRLPTDILIASLDPPSPMAVVTVPKVSPAPRKIEFDLLTNQFAAVRWRPDGPVQATSLNGGYLTGGKVARGAGDVLYQIKDDNLVSLDPKTQKTESFDLPPDFPQFSWAMDIAYDSKRDIVSVITLGGEGFFYRFSAKTGKWLDYRSVDNLDVVALTYDPKSDRYLGWETNRKLILISGDGSAMASIPVHDMLPYEVQVFSSTTTNPGHGTTGRLFTLALSGNDVALVAVSRGAVRAIWHFDLVTEKGTLTFRKKP